MAAAKSLGAVYAIMSVGLLVAAACVSGDSKSNGSPTPDASTGGMDSGVGGDDSSSPSDSSAPPVEAGSHPKQIGSPCTADTDCTTGLMAKMSQSAGGRAVSYFTPQRAR